MDQGMEFQAFVVRRDGHGHVQGAVEDLTLDQLPEGDVLVQVKYSGVNYKDGLASIPNGQIVHRYPFIPGIDLAGIVAESSHPSFKSGDEVFCTGYKLGVSHEGGFSQYARVPGEWMIHPPEGLSLKETMAIGTAGFTAALSIDALIRNGLSPDKGPVLITGATGGVGSFAISMLSRLGYQVTASTGKSNQDEWLRQLGAANIMTREDTIADAQGALAKQQWAAVVDPVGGAQLGSLLKKVHYGGSVALSGLTGGSTFESTVFPFILRGINLLGIDSVFCPMTVRKSIWTKLSDEWRPVSALAGGVAEYELTDLPRLLSDILAGKAVGRSVIRL